MIEKSQSSNLVSFRNHPKFLSWNFTINREHIQSAKTISSYVLPMIRNCPMKLASPSKISNEWMTITGTDNSPRSCKVFMCTKHGSRIAYENPQKAPTNLQYKIKLGKVKAYNMVHCVSYDMISYFYIYLELIIMFLCCAIWMMS